MKIEAQVSEKTQTKLNLKIAPVTVDVNIPDTLAAKVALFGEDVVNGAAEDSLVIGVQALMRRLMMPVIDKAGKVTRAPKNAADIQAAVTAWKPDVRTGVRQTAFEKATSSLSVMTADERKALLAQLQAMNSGAAAPAAATAKSASAPRPGT